jgi:hypothetical protein
MSLFEQKLCQRLTACFSHFEGVMVQKEERAVAVVHCFCAPHQLRRVQPSRSAASSSRWATSPMRKPLSMAALRSLS